MCQPRASSYHISKWYCTVSGIPNPLAAAALTCRYIYSPARSVVTDNLYLTIDLVVHLIVAPTRNLGMQYHGLVLDASIVQHDEAIGFKPTTILFRLWTLSMQVLQLFVRGFSKDIYIILDVASAGLVLIGR